MLHGKRFGEFEERCAGTLYLSDTWVEWLDTFVDVRNQLAYLRDVKQLTDQCNFLWCGAALVGVHVTVPFMCMLLDHRVTPRKLLTILPALYQELKSYPESFCKINSCAIPSLKVYFANPLGKEASPYGIDVSKLIQSYLEGVDHELMDLYLRKVCKAVAETLKKQRGNQYGFGGDINSSDFIAKNMTEEMLDDPDATHTKPIENLFGNLD